MTFQSNVLKTFDKIVRILQPNKHHEMGNLIKILKIRENIPKFWQKNPFFKLKLKLTVNIQTNFNLENGFFGKNFQISPRISKFSIKIFTFWCFVDGKIQTI